MLIRYDEKEENCLHVKQTTSNYINISFPVNTLYLCVYKNMMMLKGCQLMIANQKQF